MRRHIMGAIGLVLLTILAVMFAVYGYEQIKESVAAGICLRVGLVLVAVWLALPQIVEVTKRVPPWILGSIVLGGLAVMIWPRLALAIAPILGIMLVVQFVMWLFKPLPPRKPTSESRAEPKEEGSER